MPDFVHLDEDYLLFGGSVSFLGQKACRVAGEMFEREDAKEWAERERGVFFAVQPEALGVFCFPDFDRGEEGEDSASLRLALLFSQTLCLCLSFSDLGRKRASYSHLFEREEKKGLRGLATEKILVFLFDSPPAVPEKDQAALAASLAWIGAPVNFFPLPHEYFRSAQFVSTLRKLRGALAKAKPSMTTEDFLAAFAAAKERGEEEEKRRWEEEKKERELGLFWVRVGEAKQRAREGTRQGLRSISGREDFFFLAQGLESEALLFLRREVEQIAAGSPAVDYAAIKESLDRSEEEIRRMIATGKEMEARTRLAK